MEKLKLILVTFLILGFVTTSFAQKPGENFIPKDPKFDHLLTAENSVLLVIDFQDNPNAMKGENVDYGFVQIMKDHFYPFAGKY